MLLALTTLLFASTTSATLIARGNGLVYDTVANITWLQDANLAATNTFGVEGISAPVFGGIGQLGYMNWAEANEFIVAMNAAEYLGFNSWRLPRMEDLGAPGCTGSPYGGGDCGFSPKTIVGGKVVSELGHMYYNNFGLKPQGRADGTPIAGWGLWGNGTINGVDMSYFGERDIGPFLNVVAYYYWDEQPGFIDGTAWTFETATGAQATYYQDEKFYVWPVLDGEVPEPSTLALAVLAAVIGRRLVKQPKAPC